MARNKMSSSLITKIIAFGGSGFLTLYTNAVALYSQVFQDVLNEGILHVSLYTLMIAAGAVGIAVFVGFVFKDTIDNRGWSGAEKKTFTMGVVIMFAGWLALRNIGAIATVNNATTPLQEFQVVNDGTNDCMYFVGGDTDAVIPVYTEPKYLTVPASDDAAAYSGLVLTLNQTNFAKNTILSYRGFNLTFSDDGISRVRWRFYDKDTATTTTILDSDDGDIDIEDAGTYNIINATWLYTVSVELASYPYDNIDDAHSILFDFTHGGDYDDAAQQTITWLWVTSTAASNEDLISSLVLMLIGVIPAYLVMAQNNVFRKIKYSLRKAGIRF